MELQTARVTSGRDAPDLRGDLVDQALAEGIALHRTGDLAAATALYAAILDIDPTHAQALHLCGVVAHQQGMADVSRSLLERALRVRPDFAEAHNTFGSVLMSAGDAAGAQRHFEAALRLAPDYPDALQNLGTLHAARGDRTTAIALYERALALGPRPPERLVALGIALEAEDRHSEAITTLDEALASAPTHIPALLARAAAQRCLDRCEDACESFRQVLQIAPASIEAWIGLGTLRLDQGQTEEAIRCFDRGLALDPANPQLRFNRAIACLTAGRLDEGWRDYGARWEVPGCDSANRAFKAARWDGNTSLAGRTILLWREQGIGDELLFSSLLADVCELARHCIVECDPRLASLLQRSFPAAEVIPGGHPPHPRTAAAEIDLHAPLADPARLLRPSQDRYPQRSAHLRADADRIAHWRTTLARLGTRPKIGISWRSSNLRGVRALACTSLTQWHDLLTDFDVDWVNLQYDRCDDELAQSFASTGVSIHRFPGLDMLNDLDDTAALIASLDLVITAPTTVSVLSAGLGVPTWQLTCGADWTTLGTNGVPWLPAMRRFHRGWQRGWPSVLSTVALELRAFLDRRIAAG